MKIYITKYALTKGIIEAEAEVKENPKRARIIIIDEGGGWSDIYFYEKDFHLDLNSALAEAEQIKAKKISSLEKSLQKMKNMKFKVVNDVF